MLRGLPLRHWWALGVARWDVRPVTAVAEKRRHVVAVCDGMRPELLRLPVAVVLAPQTAMTRERIVVR